METKLEINKFNPSMIKKYWKNQIPHHIENNKVLNSHFEDPYFPPNRNSLLSMDEQNNFIDQLEGKENAEELENIEKVEKSKITWKKASEILENCVVFEEKIELDDIKQGTLGNCYFLSSISALTELPYIIYEKFKTKVFNKFGYYEIILFIDGEWQIVFIDDYIPYFEKFNQFAFASPNGNELWVILLEKAWAKINGGYSNTIGGIVYDPLFVLTGCSTENLNHNRKNLKEIWDRIEKADKKDNVMCCGSTSTEDIDEVGLINEHAYTLIGCKSYVKINSEDPIQLLKLRNPWGQKEWIGSWSDTCKYWTEELKECFGVVNQDDGTFFMSLEDYVKYFESTQICHLNYDHSIKFYTVDFEKYFQHPLIFNLHLEKDCKISLSVIFRHWRCNRNLRNAVRPFNLIIAGYSQNRDVLSLEGNFECLNDVEYYKNLKKGFYVIWLYCPYEKYDCDKPFKYTFRITSQFSCVSKFIGVDNQYILISKLLVDYIKSVDKLAIEYSKSFYIADNNINILDVGLRSLVFINKNKMLDLTIIPVSIENIHLLPPCNGMQSINIKIPPFQGIAIIGAFLNYSKVKFEFEIRTRVYDTDKEYKTYSDLIENYLLTEDISMEEDLFNFSYKFISNKNAKEIPDLKELSELKSIDVTIERLKLDFPSQIIDKFLNLDAYPDTHDASIKEIYLDDGIYIGNINKFKNFEGKGIFIWLNNESDKKFEKFYVGYWTDRKMNISGTILDADFNVIYEGEFSEGYKSGIGKLYYDNGDFYQGKFMNDVKNGRGSYTYSNGNQWQGEFKDDMKNGLGLMICKKENKLKIMEFAFDNLINSFKVPENEKIIFDLRSQDLKKRNRNLRRSSFLLGLTLRINYIVNTVKENNMIEIVNLGDSITNTKEFKRKKKMIDNVEILRKFDEFMLNLVLKFPPDSDSVEDDNQIGLLEFMNGEYYVGFLKHGKPWGRGCFYNPNTEHTYMLSYFRNTNANGICKIYNNKHSLIYEGNLMNNTLNGYGKYYFENGDTFEGWFKNNIKHGKGKYTIFKEAGYWIGKCVDDYLDGTGKFYFLNSPFSEMIDFQNGELIKRYKKVNENKNITQHNKEKINEIKYLDKNIDIVNKLLRLIPPIDNYELDWTCEYYEDGDIYIGQIDRNKRKEGRGCYFSKSNEIHYYFGYWVNDDQEGQGEYFFNFSKNENEQVIFYRGEFKKGKMSGNGQAFYKDGSKYIGHFDNDLKNGEGMFIWGKGYSWEGTFKNDLFEGIGVSIYNDYKYTETIEYRESNILSRKNFIDHNSKEMKLKKKQIFDSLFKENDYFMKKILEIDPVPQDLVLNWGRLEMIDGFYIGQYNYLGQMHGRGMRFYNESKEYFIGYFENGLKNGIGKHYINSHTLAYDGNYILDKKCGKGIYYFSNLDKRLEGDYDEFGCGKGLYFTDDGYWQGNILYTEPNGKGEFYNLKNEYIETRYYNLGLLIDN